jgi:hypothetical protein
MLHTVIDGVTGRTVLADATEAQFDRWYDHHCFWRKPRDLFEVRPELRALMLSQNVTEHEVHVLLNDA